MDCPCHGEPMYWQKDRRSRNGGRWECRVKRQAYNAARYTNCVRAERINAQKREKYDRDPIHRIEKRLRDDSRRRQQRLDRKREAMTSGALPHEGRG